MSSEPIEVTIFGKQYSVLANKNADHIRKLALYVDNKMKEVAEMLPDVHSTGVAVLACLNIADELFSSKESMAKEIQSIDEVVSSLVKHIDIRLAGEK